MKIKVKDIQYDSELEVDIKDIVSTNVYYRSTKTEYSLDYSVRFDTGPETGSFSHVSTIVIPKKDHDRIKKIIKNRQVKKIKQNKLIDNPFYGIEI